MYHHNCYFNFVNKKNIPSNRDEPDRKWLKIGRKEDTAAKDSFMEICKFLETNDDDQVTVRDLIEMMESKLKYSNSSAYSYPYMVTKLNEHFGDNIVITNLPGKINIITFRKKTSKVLQRFYQESNRLKNPEDEKLRIIKTGA